MIKTLLPERERKVRVATPPPSHCSRPSIIFFDVMMMEDYSFSFYYIFFFFFFVVYYVVLLLLSFSSSSSSSFMMMYVFVTPRSSIRTYQLRRICKSVLKAKYHHILADLEKGWKIQICTMNLEII